MARPHEPTSIVGSDPPPPPGEFSFPRSLRLSHARQFTRLRASPVRKTVGPLLVYAAANELPHNRLGLAVSTRVGSAVKRARIKRLLRESFRLLQHDLPGGYDLLISVRPHDTRPLAEYQRLLREAVRSLHQSWLKTQRRSPATPSDRPPPA